MRVLRRLVIAAALLCADSPAFAAQLTGSNATAVTGTVNITTEGSADWIAYNATVQNRKSTGGTKISTPSIASVNSGVGQTNSQWSDGTPSTSFGPNNWVGANFATTSFTVPADTTQRTVWIYWGEAISGTGTLTATISDGSSSPYTVTSSTSFSTQRTQVIYSAASAGRTLTIQIATANNSYILAVTLAVTGAAAATFDPIFFGGGP